MMIWCCCFSALSLFFFTALGKLLEDENCSGGVMFDGLCFSTCPSNFSPVGNSCLQNMDEITNDPEAFPSFLEEPTIEASCPCFPEVTFDRGYYFLNSSLILIPGPALFSYHFSYSSQILILADGQIFSELNEIFQLSSSHSHIEIMFMGNTLKSSKEFEYGKWMKISFQFQLTKNKNIIIKLLLDNTLTTSTFFISKIPDLDNAIFFLGDSHKRRSGFIGFMFEPKIFNYLYIEDKFLVLPECEISKELALSCENYPCISCKCGSKTQRKLTSYVTPAGISCPLFYLETTPGTCTITSNNKIVFLFNQLNGSIPDSASYTMSLNTASLNAFPNINYDSDPIPSYDRGFYFGLNNNNSMTTSIPFMFGLFFYVDIWINPSAYSGVFKKHDIIHLNISNSGLGIGFYNNTDTYWVNQSMNIPLNTWSYLGVNFICNKANNLPYTLQVYQNSVVYTPILGVSDLYDITDYLYIGTGNTTYYKGWIYRFSYIISYGYSVPIGSIIGSCSGCTCYAPINSCFPTCNYSSYYAFGQCFNCPLSKVCKGPMTASLCFNYNCTVCTSPSDCVTCSSSSCPTTCHQSCGTCSGNTAYDCITCKPGYKFLEMICLLICPDLYVQSSESCVASSTTSLTYNFNSNTTTVVDSLPKITFLSPSMIFANMRGWFTTSLQSTPGIYLSPYPTFMIWLQLSSYGTVLTKTDDGSIVDFTLSMVSSSLFKVTYNGQFGTGSVSYSLANINGLVWKYYVVTFYKTLANNTIDLYIDGVLIGKNTAMFDYLATRVESRFKIANTSPFYVYMFTYALSLTSSSLSSSYGSNNLCVYPISLGECLWPCGLSQYFDNGACLPCNNGIKLCSGGNYSQYITCYAYLFGKCTDNCPNLYTNSSGVCTIIASNLDFSLNVLNGPIASSNNLYILQSSSQNMYPYLSSADPVPGYKRGFYFDGGSFTGTTNLIFSNVFSVEYWVNFYDYRSLLSKSRVILSLTTTGINLFLNLMDSYVFNNTYPITGILTSWNYVGISVSGSSGISVQIFFNKATSSFSQVGNYFLDYSEPLILGGSSNSFKGFIYRFKYSVSVLNSGTQLVYTEAVPDVWNCDLGFYNQSQTCAACLNSCNCMRGTDCSLCAVGISNCQACSTYPSSTCYACASGYEMINVNQCKICSSRCNQCKYSMSACPVCNSSFIMNYDSTCMLYCSTGDITQSGSCVSSNINIFKFLFQQVQLPLTSNNFTLSLGSLPQFYPNYDSFDPIVLYQRGLYFKSSLCEIKSTQANTYLQLSNSHTFEIYFYVDTISISTVLSFYDSANSYFSVVLNNSYVNVIYTYTDTFQLNTMSIQIPLISSTWYRVLWTLKFSNNILTLNGYTDIMTPAPASTTNVVFAQGTSPSLFIGSYSNSSFFKGYIYYFSLDNYVRTFSVSTATCGGCPKCTFFGDCLVKCAPNQYYSNGNCLSCLDSCPYGCSSNISCSIQKDPLCDNTFNWLNETCPKCITGTLSSRPCTCYPSTVFSLINMACECQLGDTLYKGNCIVCYKYLQSCLITTPFFYTLSSNQFIKNSSDTITFLFNTLNGSIPDTYSYSLSLSSASGNSYPSLNYLIDPIPSKNRGFFFGKSANTTMRTSVPLMFAPCFYVGIWLNPSKYSEVFKKHDIIHLNLSSSYIGIVYYNITGEIYSTTQSSAVPLNTWSFVGVNIYYSTSSYTTLIDLYLNSVKYSSTAAPNVLHDTVDYLYIGGGNTSYYSGWIYNFTYKTNPLFSFDIASVLGTCTNCICPFTLNSCLPTCADNQFYYNKTCNNCPSSTPCNSPYVSNLCFDANCTACTNFYNCITCAISSCKTSCDVRCQDCVGASLMDCDGCASGYYSFLRLCLPRCPDFSSVNGSICSVPANPILYSFYVNSTSVTDSYGKVTFLSGMAQFGYFRGWETNSITSNQGISISPYSTFLLWIQLSVYGQILMKGTPLGFDFSFSLPSSSLAVVVFEGQINTNTLNFVLSNIAGLTWKYFVVNFGIQGESTNVGLFVDGTYISTQSVLFDYLLTTPSTALRIGNNNPMKVYSLKYSLYYDISALTSTFSANSYCVFPIEMNNCLWPCSSSQYYDNVSCQPCNSLLKTCKGPLYSQYITCYTYLNGACTDLCPTFYTNISGVCTIGSTGSYDFFFDTLNTSISSTNGLYSLSSQNKSSYPNIAVTDPVPGYKRGLFFNQTSLTGSTNLIFSNLLSIEYWANSYELGVLLSKSRFNLSLAIQGVSLSLSLMDSQSFACSGNSANVYAWNYFAALVTANGGISVSLFVNTDYKIFSHPGHFFLDSSEVFSIGKTFKGWIYRLKYSASCLSRNDLIINSEAAPDLWNCLPGYYNQSQSCLLCTNNCNCRRGTDCTLCQDPYCQVCSSYSAICTTCFSSYQFVQSLSLCKPCSKRCSTCQYYLNSCPSCYGGYLMNYDSTCMVYCANGDTTTSNSCLKSDLNIIRFVFQKVDLPISSNNFTLSLGYQAQYYPNYDKLDPIILYQRGLYFSASILSISNTNSNIFMQLSNRQTIEMYVFPMSSKGVVLSFATSSTQYITASMVTSTQLLLSYKVTDTSQSYTLSVTVPVSLNSWVRLYWTTSYINSAFTLTAYLNSGLASVNSSSNVVFDQGIGTILYLGNYNKDFFFTGYIYYLSIDNYARTFTSISGPCTCSFCTESGDCLIPCLPNEYSTNGQCSKCIDSCTYGCSSNLSCVIHSDPLCKNFSWLNGTCQSCVDKTFNSTPCKCINLATFNATKNECNCEDGFKVFNNSCDPCTRYLQPGEISIYFLASFVEVYVDFTIPVSPVSCSDIFSQDVLSSFGTSYSCLFNQNQTGVLVELGTGYTLKESTIYLKFEALKGAQQECGSKFSIFPVNITYKENPPSPVALIKVKNPVYIECLDLIADGSLSTGQVMANLLFKWEFISSIPSLMNYNKSYSASSSVSVPRQQLKAEHTGIKLTVINRFKLEGSSIVYIDLVADKSISIHFDEQVDYSCFRNKNCQFFIKDVTTCIANPQFDYSWQIVNADSFLNSSEQKYFWGVQKTKDSIFIPENFFYYMDLKFIVTVTELSSGIASSANLTIIIKQELLIIGLSQSSGSISATKDLSVYPIFNIELDKRFTIMYNWECYLNGMNSTFPYNKTAKVLYIPKLYIKLQQFDMCLLSLTSIFSLSRQLKSRGNIGQYSINFQCSVVQYPIPAVAIVEAQSLKELKIIPVFKNSSFTCVFYEGEPSQYKFNWKIDAKDPSVILSEKSAPKLAVDMSKLTKGYTYTITLSLLDKYNQQSQFNYSFLVNNPPKYGQCSVTPDSGIEITTSFFISCSDWKDLEENYPLMYSFGIVSEGSTKPLSSLIQLPYISIVIPYISDKTTISSFIYDSLEDFTVFTNSVTLQKSLSLNITQVASNLSTELSSASTSKIPNFLTILSSAVLNNGQLPASNDTLSLQNQCFSQSITGLNKLLNSSIITSQIINIATQLLQEITKNPNLKSKDNANKTMQLINNLLSKSSNIGLTNDQASEVLKALDQSVKFSSDTVYDDKFSLSMLEIVLNKLSLSMINNSIPNKESFISSGIFYVRLMTFDNSSDLSKVEIKLGNSSTVLPTELFSYYPDISKIGISSGHINIEQIPNSTLPTLLSVSVYNIEKLTKESIKLKNSEINMSIPVYNSDLIVKPACFYLNSSFQWDKAGCSVSETENNTINCSCTHLSIFSAGEGLEGGGFIPSNNLDQTIDISSLKNINATNAIGFYFISVMLFAYTIITIIAWRKDSRDIESLILSLDKKNAIDIIEKEHSQYECSEENFLNNARIEEEKLNRKERKLKAKEEEIKQNTKSGYETIIQGHRLLGIFLYNDPNMFRVVRCSLLFLLFIGKMFFVGVFYQSDVAQKANSAQEVILSYSLRDLLVMFYSIGITLMIDILLSKLMSNKPTGLEISREDNLKNIRSNRIRRNVGLAICWVIMGYFSWSICMFALNFEYRVSIMWIINTAFSLFMGLVVNPAINLLIKAYVISRIQVYFKIRKARRAIMNESNEKKEINIEVNS